MAATEETRTGSDWASEQAKRAMAPGAVWQSAASAYIRQALIDGLDGAEVTRTLNRMHQDTIGDRQR